jgi:transposase
MEQSNDKPSIKPRERYAVAVAFIREGFSVRKACEKADLSEGTYYYFRDSDNKKGSRPDSRTPQTSTTTEAA